MAIGVLSALKRGTIFDRTAMGDRARRRVAADLLHRPAGAVDLQPTVAWYRSGRQRSLPGTNPLDWAYDLSCPGSRWPSSTPPLYARLTRAGMLETMNEDYIRTARAKGLPERDVVVKHGLRAALTPILTIFGLDLGLLLGGAVLTETIFALPGSASTPSTPSTNNDLPMVLGVTLVAATFIVVANLVVDVLTPSSTRGCGRQ